MGNINCIYKTTICQDDFVLPNEIYNFVKISKKLEFYGIIFENLRKGFLLVISGIY